MAGKRDGGAAGEQRRGSQIRPQIQAACMISVSMTEDDRVNGRKIVQNGRAIFIRPAAQIQE